MKTLVAIAVVLIAGCAKAPDPPSQPAPRAPVEKFPAPAPAPKPEPAPVPQPEQEAKKAPLPDSPPAPEKPPPAKEEAKPLAVEPVDLPDLQRRANKLIVFAAQEKTAADAAAAHREGKEKEIQELPVPKAGKSAGLYLLLGHYPNPTLDATLIVAVFDKAKGVVRVTFPQWSARPGSGIGMDWAVGGHRSGTFLGFRVLLQDLPPGDYSVEVFETVREKDREASPKELSTGKFTLGR
jgi:hypothetical protein